MHLREGNTHVTVLREYKFFSISVVPILIYGLVRFCFWRS